MGSASDCRIYVKGVRKISSEKLFCGWVRRSTASFWPKECHKNAPKNMENQSQIRPKIIQKRVRRHLRAPKSPDKAAGPHFYQSFGAPGPYHHYDFDHFGLPKHVFLRSKNDQKTGPSKITFFRGFLRFLGLRAHDFHRFWVPKVIPGVRFSRGFPAIGFIYDFWHLL